MRSNPNPPLDIPHLSSLVRECGYMARSKNWKERLLLRLAKAQLDHLTQRAIDEGVVREPMKHTDRVRRKG